LNETNLPKLSRYRTSHVKISGPQPISRNPPAITCLLQAVEAAPVVGDVATAVTQDEVKEVGTASLAVLTVNVAQTMLMRGHWQSHGGSDREWTSEVVLIGPRTSAALPLDTAETAKAMNIGRVIAREPRY
jgi:hypothetical protein